MAQTLINMGQSTAMKVISNMAVSHFVNSMVMGNLVNRELTKEFHRKGDVITYNKPVRSTILDGPDITGSIADVQQQSSTLKVATLKTIPFQFGALELSLTPERFFEEVLVDAMAKLPNQVDMDILDLYKKVYYSSGPAGASDLDFEDVVDAAALQNHHGVPGARNLVLNPTSHAQLVKTSKGLFLPNYVDGIIKSAQLGQMGGYQVFMDQNVKTHTQATISGWLVNDTVATGDTTVTIDTGSGTPAVGDVFSFASVNSVNPMNYQSTGNVMKFRVVSYAANVITFTPAIVSTGAYQNVTALPADDAAITFYGSHTANLAFSKNAFTLATVPLAPIDGLEQYTATKDNVTITISMHPDILTFKSIKRLDVLYGTDVCYPEYAHRLMG